MKQRHLRTWLIMSLALTSLATTGCLKRGDNPQDPYEETNRKAFALNQKLDETFFQRPAKMMNTILPAFVRKSTLQVFHNLLEPRSFINFLFQKRGHRAMNALYRFVVNSTLGIGGIADVARSLKHEYDPTDFGITLAIWGDKDSPYWYSALTGPGTIRDSIGGVYDAILFPPYAAWVPEAYFYGAQAYYALTLRAQLLENEELIEQASFDRYILIRDAYLQNRHFMITGQEAASSKEDDADVIAAATAADKDKDDSDAIADQGKSTHPDPQPGPVHSTEQEKTTFDMLMRDTTTATETKPPLQLSEAETHK